jgi:hypothetical protein
MEGPDAGDIARATRALGARPVTWEPATRGGQTAAARWRVTLTGGTRAFLKIGATIESAAWIRDEHLAYAQLRGAAFLPQLLGFHDDGDRPVLAIEDLGTARWPPPWDEGAVAAVLACLEEVHGTSPPSDLPDAARHQARFAGAWREVADAPAAFLSLGLCGPRWLEGAVPTLAAAAGRAAAEGTALLHWDVRSDNLCLLGDRAMLVDWNWACVGNPRWDLAFWLPSLEAEGGPPPEAVMTGDDVPALAAIVAGYFCLHAGGPEIPEAPHVRPLQRMQARTALPWAARALGLPPPA